MIILWICFLLFLVLSITFFCGKGSFLISGYNTANPEERDRYDEKKLLQVTGSFMGVCALAILFMIFFLEIDSGIAMGVFVAVILLDIIVTMILTNTICRKKTKKGENESADACEQKRQEDQSGKIAWAVIGFTVVLFAVMIVICSTGNIEVAFEEEQLNIQCSYWPDQSIECNEIQSVTYSENWEPGKRVGGFGSFRLNLGRFENPTGRYHLYAYTGCDHFVVIDTDRGVVVINGRDEEATRELYEMIIKKIGKNKENSN